MISMPAIFCSGALAGENAVIANNGAPTVRLVKIGAHDVARKPGAWSALTKAQADWDTPATNTAIAGALTGGKLP